MSFEQLAKRSYAGSNQFAIDHIRAAECVDKRVSFEVGHNCPAGDLTAIRIQAKKFSVVLHALTEPSRLLDEVIPFRYARRPIGGYAIVRDCGLVVASHFQ